MSESGPLRGSCLCSKVSYEVRGSPVVMYYCHCGTCQKATGSSFATNIIVRAEDFVTSSGREALSSFGSYLRRIEAPRFDICDEVPQKPGAA